MSRGFLKGDVLADVKEIFVADAWETGGNMAGRVFFGPDGMLYVTVGDRDRICCNANQRRPDGSDDNSLRMKSQSLDNHVGKTLRLSDDGTVPPDNPFVGAPGAKPEIFTYGHRNGYGLAVHPETGELWQAEIGPLGGDEVNVLAPGTTTAGRSCRWAATTPARSRRISRSRGRAWTTRACSGCRRSARRASCSTPATVQGLEEQPVRGRADHAALIRVAFGQPSQAERREGLLIPIRVRIRDVQQGPDGYIYVATEGASGGNASDGMVLRIEPAE